MRKISLFLLLSFVLLLSACSSTSSSGRPIQDFNYIDQEGKSFGLEDLKGKVSLATFIYTYCPTECPMMTLHMSEVQQDVIDAGLKDVQFVSFSIDPEIDKPEVLKKYGESFGADFSNWHFLTGYTQEEIEDWGPKNFKTVIKKSRDDDFVVHMFDFYLINKKGEIISQYNGYQDVPFKQILKDMKSALKQ
ncbi:SCO family protein [Bacillus sp. FJAT-50079]|uniref:SCO family protein n=1 Tax=Bacillus sp. FJAT-50079 TaxID=2833577 RepID=UPI001BC9603C|nr:SCO family protein [Bacillus sp. FJAT-50079]MBS4210685.1 SCO family protein [Bacillus sp. FJAT-50079]